MFTFAHFPPLSVVFSLLSDSKLIIVIRLISGWLLSNFEFILAPMCIHVHTSMNCTYKYEQKKKKKKKRKTSGQTFIDMIADYLILLCSLVGSG